jgi:hypothetical protein
LADGKRGLPYIERNPVVAGVEGIQNPEDYRRPSARKIGRPKNAIIYV